MLQRALLNFLTLGSVMSALFLFASLARAGTIWTDWTSFTTGSDGSAIGTLGGVGVTYTGELDDAVIDGSSSFWDPDSSFTGGVVTASPSVVGDHLRLNGSSEGTNIITFSSFITNPVFAIWSLGVPSTPASFSFDATPTLEAGGPNSLFGGSPIVVSGSTVSGEEGNGVVEFAGTFSSIAWTNTFEDYYVFQVGFDESLEPSPTPVPEPTTWSLMLVGLGLAGLMSRAGRRRFASFFSFSARSIEKR